MGEKMNTARTTAFAAIMAAALPAWAADPLEAEMARAGIGPADVAAVVRTSEQLRDHGVTPDPVANKVREGLAKKAPPQAISAAASRLAGRMLEVAPLYPGRADAAQKTATVEAAAKAMIAGGRIESVKALFDRVASSGLERHEWHRPFDVCGALTIAGAGEGPSAAIVSAALDRGYPVAEISALAVRFGRLVSSGQTPQQAASSLLDAVGRETGHGAGFGHGRSGPALRDGPGEDGKGPEADNSLYRGSGRAKDKKPGTPGTGAGTGTGGGGGTGSGGKGGK
jgi:hypothetical protein